MIIDDLQLCYPSNYYTRDASLWRARRTLFWGWSVAPYARTTDRCRLIPPPR